MRLSRETVCPGCGLVMPLSRTASYEGYYNTSPECWELYSEVLGAEYSSAVLYGHVHQLTVDSYAVQHAGAKHPDKSVGIHLSGLYLVLEQGRAPATLPPLLQRLAGVVRVWPHFPPPERRGRVTVFSVALVASQIDHVNAVQEWAASVWDAWSVYHADVAGFVERHLT